MKWHSVKLIAQCVAHTCTTVFSDVNTRLCMRFGDTEAQGRLEQPAVSSRPSQESRPVDSQPGINLTILNFVLSFHRDFRKGSKAWNVNQNLTRPCVLRKKTAYVHEGYSSGDQTRLLNNQQWHRQLELGVLVIIHLVLHL